MKHRKISELERGDFVPLAELLRDSLQLATVENVTLVDDIPHKSFITITIGVNADQSVESYR